MKREEIQVGQVYAKIDRIKWREASYADDYVMVIDTGKWWAPSWSSWYSRDNEPTNQTFPIIGEVKVSAKAKVVDKYPSDGKKGVLVVRVDSDGNPIPERYGLSDVVAYVTSTASLRMLKSEYEAMLAERKKAADEANARRIAERAARDARFEALNERMEGLGLPSLKQERTTWDGRSVTNWKYAAFHVGEEFRLSYDELVALCDTFESMSRELVECLFDNQ